MLRVAQVEDDAMDEKEWLTGTDPEAMLEFLGANREMSKRKALLFGVGCCWRVRQRLTDAHNRRAMEAGEMYADGSGSAEKLRAALDAAYGSGLYASGFLAIATTYSDVAADAAASSLIGDRFFVDD